MWPGLVDDEAGAERLLLLLLGEERVAEERVGRDGDDAGRGDLHDAGRRAAVDVVDRERRRRAAIATAGGPPAVLTSRTVVVFAAEPAERAPRRQARGPRRERGGDETPSADSEPPGHAVVIPTAAV